MATGSAKERLAALSRHLGAATVDADDSVQMQGTKGVATVMQVSSPNCIVHVCVRHPASALVTRS